MNWESFLVAMSGPAQAVIRYGLTALGAWLATKGWVDADAWTGISGGILAGLSALIGVMTSTKTAVLAKADAVTSK